MIWSGMKTVQKKNPKNFYFSKFTNFNLNWESWEENYKTLEKNLLLKFYILILDISYNIAIIRARSCEYQYWQCVFVCQYNNKLYTKWS